ncbi:MAG: aromatic acid exporter family protein [Erysipelotrichaceae bacterium]
MKQELVKYSKIAIGATLAMAAATLLGLAFAPSAGIITLLSIQDTKKDTLQVAYKRFVSFFLMLVLATVLFRLLGAKIIVFGLFLLIFGLLSSKLQILEGLSISAVLATHLFVQETIGLGLLLNEVLLMCIGVGIGVLINLKMLDQRIAIQKDMQTIEEAMKAIFAIFAHDLTHVDKTCAQASCRVLYFDPVKRDVEQALQRAEVNIKNNLRSDTSYYFRYLLMRKQQLGMLRRMSVRIQQLDEVTKDADAIAHFFSLLQASFHEYNNVEDLYHVLEAMLEEYRQEALPKTRKEFETRAILFSIVQDLQLFLDLKREFIFGLSAADIKRYWGVVPERQEQEDEA